MNLLKAVSFFFPPPVDFSEGRKKGVNRREYVYIRMLTFLCWLLCRSFGRSSWSHCRRVTLWDNYYLRSDDGRGVGGGRMGT